MASCGKYDLPTAMLRPKICHQINASLLILSVFQHFSTETKNSSIKDTMQLRNLYPSNNVQSTSGLNSSLTQGRSGQAALQSKNEQQRDTFTK